jgi:Family of unknown function (DUF6494)
MTMDEEALNTSVRKFLRKFGVIAQRELAVPTTPRHRTKSLWFKAGGFLAGGSRDLLLASRRYVTRQGCRSSSA